jgi:hypothetical protein
MLPWEAVRLASLLAACSSLLLLAVSCSSKKSGSTFLQDDVDETGGTHGSGSTSGGSGHAQDGGTEQDGVTLNPLDPDAFCGYTSITARQDPAKIYFVLDRSGSMSDGGGKHGNKYETVRLAVIDLSTQIGFRSRLGAAVFPAITGDACAAGAEVMPLQDGDPKSYADKGQQGPVTKKLAQAINVSPKGGTPTGSTLTALVPKLSKLGKNTYVILATDGGPNCNTGAACGSNECIPNIEADPGCTKDNNCCDPKVDPSYSTGDCLDSNATLSAVTALDQAGVKTLVVGIPGSAAYGTLLDLLAVAGGAPRDGTPRYYRVDDIDDLEGLLLTVGSQVTVSCDISLDSAPNDPSAINLYFDTTLVVSDMTDGWSYSNSTTITLHGKACDTLLSGGVGQVQVFEGCPTQGVN